MTHTFEIKDNFYLDGKLLLDYDLDRGGAEKSASRMLEKGFHAVELNYYQMGGKKSLNIGWKKPGSTNRKDIPANVLWH